MNAYDPGGLTLSDVPCARELALVDDFPMEDVMDRLDGQKPRSSHPEAEGEAIRRIAEWMWQGCANLDGFAVRAAVVCWIFHQPLRPYSMTRMAGRLGKKKQSLGRWVDSFKREFPAVTDHITHLRNTRVRQSKTHRRSARHRRPDAGPAGIH